MQDKWNVKNERIFENTCMLVNVKTKKILSMKVTDEHVHDSKALPELVDDIIKSDRKLTIGKLFADVVLMKVMRFLDIWKTMESYHVLK